MTNEFRVWGLHMGEHVGSKPIDEGYVAIGWQELGDLREYANREAYKAAIAEKIPGAKQGAHPVYAGILYRFTHEMKAGDIVIYPSKHDRMLITGLSSTTQSALTRPLISELRISHTLATQRYEQRHEQTPDAS